MPLIGLDDPLLRGGGGNYFSFKTAGDTVTGVIVDARKSQQTEFGTNKPKVYEDSGNPMMQIIVTLQTTLRDPANAGDKGLRDVYIKSGQPTQRLAEVLRELGVAGLDVGGTLTMQYIGDGVATRGLPPKHYNYAYVAPAALPVEQIAAPAAQPNYGYLPPTQTLQSAPLSQPLIQQPAAAPAVAFAQPQLPGVGTLMGQAPAPQQPAPAPAAGGMSPEQIAVWSQLTPEQRTQLGLPSA